jgi:hypothetical protein
VEGLGEPHVPAPTPMPVPHGQRSLTEISRESAESQGWAAWVERTHISVANGGLIARWLPLTWGFTGGLVFGAQDSFRRHARGCACATDKKCMERPASKGESGHLHALKQRCAYVFALRA